MPTGIIRRFLINSSVNLGLQSICFYRKRKLVISFEAFFKQFVVEMKEEGEEEEDPARLLKEFLGHTPLEVLGGALLGVLIGTLMPVA